MASSNRYRQLAGTLNQQYDMQSQLHRSIYSLYPRVLVFATTLIVRLGIQEFVRVAGVEIAASAPTVRALNGCLRLDQQVIIVSDGDDRIQALSIASQFQVPLLVLAISERQAEVIRADLTLTGSRCSVIDMSTEDAVPKFTEALVTIAAGECYVHMRVTDRDDTSYESVVPLFIAQRLRCAEIPPRYLEVLWLDALGWSTAEIAQRLSVTEETVRSYRKRTQQTMRLNRTGLLKWIRQQLTAPADDKPLDERSVGR